VAGKSSLLSPSALLRQRSIQRGLFGGSRGWMAIGVLVWGPRLLKRLMGRNEELVASERLRPGESLQLVAVKTPTRRERKATKQVAN
jgi:hypothetical protein